MEKKDEFKKVAITYEMFDEKGVCKQTLEEKDFEQVAGGTIISCFKKDVFKKKNP